MLAGNYEDEGSPVPASGEVNDSNRPRLCKNALNNWIIAFWATHMKRFVQGESRIQSTLLPESLDDYVTDTNLVRVVDIFVDELDLGKLGFEGVVPAATGRPSYHPAVLLKIYIYGYLNRVQSSRRLERESQRNVELMWLTGRLMPDFKTIANFGKDNGKAIRSGCRQFVVLCQQLGLFSETLVAIDGGKFQAVNSRDLNFTSAKLQRRMEEIESSINRLPHGSRYGRPSGTRSGASQDRTAAGQDCHHEDADADTPGNRSPAQRNTGQTDIPHRSPFDEDAGNRDRRLQRSDHRRCDTPSDWCA